MRAILGQFSATFRLIVGMVVMMPGFYFVFVSVHKLLTSEMDLTRALIAGSVGLLMAVIGGFIMSDAIAIKIATGVANALKPFLSYLPGGRRRTDPPAADRTLDAPITEKEIQRSMNPPTQPDDHGAVG